MLSGKLFTHEVVHMLLSVLAAIVAWSLLPKKKKHIRKYIILVTLGAFLGELLLDTDHLFDYMVAYGLQFRLDYFLRGNMFHKLGKIFLPFHAWEWTVVLGIGIYLAKNTALRYFLIALTFGLLFHLIYDTFYNHMYVLGYSLIYRFIHGFDTRYLALPD